MVQKEQEGRCLSAIPHSGSPSSTAFLQLCLLVLRPKVHRHLWLAAKATRSGVGASHSPAHFGLGVLAAKTPG